MYILETFTDTWNYTFLIVSLFAIAVGTFIVQKKMKNDEYDKRHEKRSNNKQD